MESAAAPKGLQPGLMDVQVLAQMLKRAHGPDFRLDCFAPQACEHLVELDGDGVDDRVMTLTNDGACGQVEAEAHRCRQGLAIFLSSGAVEVVGAGRAVEAIYVDVWFGDGGKPEVELGPHTIEGDLEALIGMGSRALTGPASARVAARGGLPHPGALGNMVTLNFGDVFYGLYLTSDGWSWVDMGY